MTSFFFKNILIRGGGPPTYILCPSSYFTLAPALNDIDEKLTTNLAKLADDTKMDKSVSSLEGSSNITGGSSKIGKLGK
jgi:hypothetical protein